MMVTNNPEKFLFTNEKLFNTWFECWLISHVPKLMHYPKWFQTDRDIKVGDVVLFSKQESQLSSSYQYGMISDLSRSSDDKICKATVRYRNSTEAVDRFTNRAVQQLIAIHPVDKLNMMEELGQIATFGDMQYKLTTSPKDIFGPCWGSVTLLTITHELYTKMFCDQKFQVVLKVPFFVQVQHKYFCSKKIAKS